MEYILIGWIACGITTSYIAKQKGKNGWLWLGLGLLFPLFALIAICATPAQAPTPVTVGPSVVKPAMAPADRGAFLAVMAIIAVVAYMLHSMI